MATPAIPSAEFNFPNLLSPPPGLTVDEMDVGQAFTQNANSTNEGTDKLRSLLIYFHMFEEVELVDNNGFKRVCLVRRTGKEEAPTTCSLGTLFTDPTDGDKRYLQQGTVNSLTAHTVIGGEDTSFHPETSSLFVRLNITMETEGEGEDAFFTGLWAANSPPELVQDVSTPIDDEIRSSKPSDLNIYAPLGRWDENTNGDLVWSPEGCGAVTFQICLLNAYWAQAHYFRS